MKHFIQFDENGEIQFVITAEFDAQISKEQKDKFIEVTEAEAQEIKKNPKDHLVSAGKVIKKPPKSSKPAENVLLPRVDEYQLEKKLSKIFLILVKYTTPFNSSKTNPIRVNRLSRLSNIYFLT